MFFTFLSEVESLAHCFCLLSLEKQRSAAIKLLVPTSARTRASEREHKTSADVQTCGIRLISNDAKRDRVFVTRGHFTHVCCPRKKMSSIPSSLKGAAVNKPAKLMEEHCMSNVASPLIVHVQTRLRRGSTCTTRPRSSWRWMTFCGRYRQWSGLPPPPPPPSYDLIVIIGRRGPVRVQDRQHVHRHQARAWVYCVLCRRVGCALRAPERVCRDKGHRHCRRHSVRDPLAATEQAKKTKHCGEIDTPH